MMKSIWWAKPIELDHNSSSVIMYHSNLLHPRQCSKRYFPEQYHASIGERPTDYFQVHSFPCFRPIAFFGWSTPGVQPCSYDRRIIHFQALSSQSFNLHLLVYSLDLGTQQPSMHSREIFHCPTKQRDSEVANLELECFVASRRFTCKLHKMQGTIARDTHLGVNGVYRSSVHPIRLQLLLTLLELV